MDARDFFPIAERFRHSTAEAERRTSVGRSYYALFNVVIGELASRGVIFRSTPEDHRTVISYLTKIRHKAASSVGLALNDLRRERNRADYELNDVLDARTSDFVYQKATRALKQFEAISGSDLALIISRIQALP